MDRVSEASLERPQPAGPPQMVEEDVVGDAAQPGRELGLAVKAGEGVPGLAVGLLGQVGGQVGVAAKTPQKGVHPPGGAPPPAARRPYGPLPPWRPAAGTPGPPACPRERAPRLPSWW